MASIRKRGNKFKAITVKEDGHTFDSKTEHLRYLQLRQELADGLIRNLEHHVRYYLHVNGERLGYYEADFVYNRLIRINDSSGAPWTEYWDVFKTVEDVKSPYTAKFPMYRWKKKHMKAEYGIDIQEVYPKCPTMRMKRKAAKRAHRRAMKQALVRWLR